MKFTVTIQRELLRLMRFSIIQLCFMAWGTSLALANDTHAQEILNRPLSITVENEPIQNVLKVIEKEAAVSFSYRKGLFKKSNRLTISAKNERLAEVLNRLCTPAGVQYEVVGEQIVLTPSEKTSQVSPPVSGTKTEQLALETKPVVLAFTVKGIVKDETGEPLPGATVSIKGTKTGTIADMSGKFTINAPNGTAILVVQYTGYQTTEFPIENRSEVIVDMAPIDNALNEVVVVGYGTTNRRDILGAVGSVKEKAIEQTAPSSTLDAMQGRLSGVQIVSNGGPGSGSDIRIRGTSTFSGGVTPLYVVDGQQLEDINNLNPNDIASIEILKDGASAAMYGSKSANGVVIITTKAGKAGEAKFSVDFNQSYNYLASSIPTANTRQRFFYENVRGGGNPFAIPADSLSVLYQISNNLQELITRVSNRSQVNLALSGGTDKARFYWNTGYLEDQGIVINSSYRRMSSRLKMDMDVKKRLKATSNVTFSYEMQKGLNEAAVFQQIAERIPYFPLFEPDGSLTVEIAGRANPVAEAREAVRDRRNFRAQNLNVLEFTLMKGLTFKSTLGVNFRYETFNAFDPTIVQTPPRPPTGEQELELSFDYQQENYFTYKKSFKKIHTITAIAGTQLQRWNQETSNLDATSFSSDNIRTFNNVLELNAGGTTSTATRHSLLAAFADVTYDFKGRYRIKSTLRRDGSSRFGANRRYGYFPSAQIGWRISDEPFLKDIKHLDNLMLRYTYGENGNERIGNYDSRLLYRPGSRYNGLNGTANFQLANPDLSWESTVSQNLGIDLTMFRTRLNVSIDLWNKNTKDLLYNVPLPEETGFSTVRRNIGAVQNRGIDVSVGGVLFKTRNFEWSADFNITFLKNKVLQLNDPDGFTSGNFFIKEGLPMFNMFGYRNKGVFQYNESNAFSNDGRQLTPVFGENGLFSKYTLDGADYTGTINRMRVGAITLLGGDIWWEDLDGNYSIDAFDRQVLGNGLADYFGGASSEFKYKDFSVAVLFNYNFGNQIFRNYDQQRNDLNSANETPAPERIENAWLRPGDVAEYASLDRNRAQNRLGPNSQYIVNGDFIKWNNIRFSYAMPAKLLKKTKWFSKLAVNVSINNPLVFTNYTGFNPELGGRGNPLELGQDNLRYPAKREFLFGLSMQL